MRNPLPNPFIAGEATIFLRDTESFMATAVRDLPTLDEPASVLVGQIDDEPVHKTHATEFERFDLDALSRQLKTKLAARNPEVERSTLSENELKVI